MIYEPDRWVVLKLKYKEETVYKVLAGWNGGYLGGDSWKLNSGITKVEMDGDNYLFYGYSGSVYKCRNQGYGFTGLTASVLGSWEKQINEKITVLDERGLNVLRQVYG